MRRRPEHFTRQLILFVLLRSTATSSTVAKQPAFTIHLPAKHAEETVLGRVRLYLSTDCDEKSLPPRAQCSDDQSTSQVFGIDTPDTGLKPGEHVIVDDTTRGYPRHGIRKLPAGAYCVQAELVRYKRYKRGDGATVTLPASCVSNAGSDGAYASPAGTLFSDVLSYIVVEPGGGVGPVALSLDYEVPAAPSPGCSGKGGDTQYIKTVRAHSALLSSFWGQPMELEACVLLPWGFEAHPNAKYPLVVAHGHYSPIFQPGGRFDSHPPSRNQSGYAYVDQEYAYWLYRNWTSPTGPFHKARALVVTINQPVPYFDDAYAVDSANIGPYGSAILTELLPLIEQRYRGIGQGWARGLMGGSTGGWEALASQVLYPDAYNYAVAACPDPIGFTSYATINLYEDTNAYYYDSQFKRTPRPGYRDRYSGVTVVPGTSVPTYGSPYGQTTATIEEMNRREMVLGPKSRSCGQWDVWEAVFGPRGEDGYPARVWCKDPSPDADCQYGQINRTVVDYWREHFDLTARLKREWSGGLGAKLSGKLHVYVGAGDSFFLNNAVMDLQDWVTESKPTLEPPFGGEILIGAHDGRGYEHCFNGYLPDGTPAPNAITRELYVTKFLPRMAERWAASAPQGANMEWHTY